MEPFLSDHDVTLYHGDVESVLAGMPDESVDCVVTSPPYWGLRDYGTGLWDGGDPDCDHAPSDEQVKRAVMGASGLGKTHGTQEEAARSRMTPRDECWCGARRVDQQLGLEPTPDLYVERIVAVFRQVRRVLAPHGTCWVNLGDSYAGGNFRPGTNQDDLSEKQGSNAGTNNRLGQNRVIPPGFKHKDLIGIPWRVAFALQADGWWLRADVIWAKPNPMPESVTDRPTKAHEYLFLLTKAPRYYFDQEAVREPHIRLWGDNNIGPNNSLATGALTGIALGRAVDPHGGLVDAAPNPSGRNVRSVWQIATQPYPEAHFATYPEELVRRCVLAGCPARVCRVCGKPSERIVEREAFEGDSIKTKGQLPGSRRNDGDRNLGGTQMAKFRAEHPPTEVGWSDCGHNDWRPGTVLDPFIGSGTTCKVTRDHGRHSIGIDLSADYLNLAARRLQQLSLLT